MHPSRCAACERAVYGGPVDEADPCKAAYKLFQEITSIVGIKTTRKEEVEALDDFVTYPVTRDMISYIAEKSSDVIPCSPDDRNTAENGLIPDLEYFIASVVDRSHCQVPTLMTSLVFLARLKDRLPHIAQGLPCTRHRLFLASLILAAKYVNDSSPKNKHWAIYSHVKDFPEFGFSLTEVNLMEKQLLYLLDWDLVITEDDLLTHFEPFLAQVRWDRASVRLEKELIRRKLVIDEDSQLPAPQFVRALPPKGTKPPTVREREHARAAGILYPDEERHQFLLSKCESKKPIVATPPILVAADEEESSLVEQFTSSVSSSDSLGETSSDEHDANGALFSLEGSNFSVDSLNEYAPYQPIKVSKNKHFPVDMSRSSTQDSYLSNSNASSRFNSVSREVTPASSMTSLSSDDLDYSCHDDEDQLDVFMNEPNSTNCSFNPSPEFQYQYSLASKAKSPPAIYGSAPAKRVMTRGSRGVSAVGQGYRSLSPQVRIYEKQAAAGGSQRVSPTQGHTGVAKKGKGGSGESKSMARIRQTLQGLEGETDGEAGRASKRSRFLPKFLGGGIN